MGDSRNHTETQENGDRRGTLHVQTAVHPARSGSAIYCPDAPSDVRITIVPTYTTDSRVKSVSHLKQHHPTHSKGHPVRV
jgi:hypothetical protein